MEAKKLDNHTNTIDAVIHIAERLMRCGLQHCKFDPEWKRLIRTLLGKLEGVNMLRSGDIDKLVRYHHLLWKTGEGWTYTRSLREMSMTDAYQPRILTALEDNMSSITQMSCESLDDFETDTMEGEFSALIGSVEDWKVISIIQFFAETEGQATRLTGPISQKTKAVHVKDGNDWTWLPATEASDALKEQKWPGVLIQEDFTRTNSMKKLYELRPDEEPGNPGVEGMCFAEFLCQYRHIKRNHPQYKRILRLLKESADKLGPRCERTLIAGTLEMAPKFLKLKNDEIVALKEKKDVIIRLAANDQVLSDKSKVYLFGNWRRPEKSLLEEEVARADIKHCDAVRLQLFPSSTHLSE